MSTHVEDSSRQATTPLLQRVMRGNAIFSSSSGVVLIAAASALAPVVGIPWPLALTITGTLLLLYGPVLWWLAERAEAAAWPGWLAVTMDVLWVAGSMALVFGGLLPLTTAGIWIVIVLAEIVAGFAVLQYVGIRRLAGN